MMRTLNIFLLALLLPNILFAQSGFIKPEKVKQLDSLYQSFFKPQEPGAIIVVAQEGKILFKKAYGMSDLEKNIPLSTEHKMGIGSISKQFCAIAILLLQQEGKLNIKDDIHQYLPQYNTYGRKITIQNLLSHTSGIPSYTEIYEFAELAKNNVPIQRLVKLFESKPLIYEPGSNWSYSNSGYVLAGLIIEKITGKPFNDFLQQRIFKPLLMNDTYLGSSTELIPNKTGEYAVNAKGRIKVESTYDWYWAYAAGQIVSTVDDMVKWNEGLNDTNFIKPSLLSLAHQSFILTDGTDAHYGLGWATGSFKNKTMIQHGGSIGGYRSQGMRIPVDHLYFLVMSNSALTNSGLVANKTLSVLYDMPPLKEKKDPSLQWKDWEGVYEAPSSGLRLQLNFGPTPTYYTIRVDSNQKVTVQRTGGTKSVLTPAGKDLLFDKSNPFAGWQAERNTSGEITGIRFTKHFPGYGPDRFNKKVSTQLPGDKLAQKADSILLQQCKGIYEHSLGDRMIVKVDEGGITIENSGGGPKVKCYYIGHQSFYLKDVDQEFVFETDKKGQVIGCHFFNGNNIIQMKKIDDPYIFTK